MMHRELQPITCSQRDQQIKTFPSLISSLSSQVHAGIASIYGHYICTGQVSTAAAAGPWLSRTGRAISSLSIGSVAQGQGYERD